MTFTDLPFVDNETGWMMGHSYRWDGYLTQSFTIKTTDGGQTWDKLLNSSNTIFNDQCFTDSDHGWIVGNRNKTYPNSYNVLKTLDGGRTGTRHVLIPVI